MFTPRLSLAHSAGDTYVARVIDAPSSTKDATAIKTNRARGPRRWLRRAFKAQVFVVALLVFIGGDIANAQPAHANWFSSAVSKVFCAQSTWFNEPIPARSGITALLGDGTPVESTWMDEKRTGYEMFGLSGKWTVYRGGESSDALDANRAPLLDPASSDIRSEDSTDECVPMVPLIGNMAANILMSTSNAITGASIWILDQAFNPDWLTGLTAKVSEVITGTSTSPGLRDSLYFPFLNLAILLAAIHLFWTGVVKRKSIEAMTSAFWMIGTVIVGSVFVYNPALLADAANSAITEVSAGVLAATAGNTIDGEAAEGSLCGIDMPSNADPKQTRDGVVRVFQCNLWESFIFVPWATGQWGETSPVVGDPDAQPTVDMGGGESASGYAISQLKAETVTPNDVGHADAREASQARWNAVVDAVATTGTQEQIETWKGYDTGSRLSIAMASLVASVCAAIIVMTLGLALVGYQLGIAILVFVGPFYLLVGVHPGLGRRMALKWAEMVVGTVMKALITVVLLSMTVTMLGFLLRDSVESWGASIIGLAAFTAAVLMYRKELLAVAAPNFGGSGGLSTAPMEKAGNVLRGVAGGAVVGAGAGMAGGFKGAGAILSDTSRGGALKRVASATATASKATAAGTASGIKRGAMHAGVGGSAALLMAGNASRGSAARVTAKAVNSGSLGQPETPQEDNPAAYAREVREADRAQERYTQDWERHHTDAGWNSSFVGTYGFEAPNPYESSFAGYGKPRTALSADLMPRPIRPGAAPVEAPTSSRESKPVNTPPAIAPSRMSVPMQQGAPVVPTRPVKPQARTGGGAIRPRS